MPRKIQTGFHVVMTEDQLKALVELAGGNASEYIRNLIAADAEKRGIKWPEFVARGKYPRRIEH
jgi:hypothetical protein